jgi:hypothetical protein
MLAWMAPSFVAVKGVIHAPSAKPAMKVESRDALLTAIAKARDWIDDIRLGRIASFAEIGECRRFSLTRKSHSGDRTDWLRRQSVSDQSPAQIPC